MSEISIRIIISDENGERAIPVPGPVFSEVLNVVREAEDALAREPGVRSGLRERMASRLAALRAFLRSLDGRI